MSNLPSIDGKKMLKILRKAGFEVIRIKGSHHFIRHSDGRSTVIPVHGNQPLKIGLLKHQMKIAGLTESDL